MVSMPRAEIEAAAERFARAQIFDFSSKLHALLAQPADQQPGDVIERQRNLIASLRAELVESYSIDGSDILRAKLDDRNSLLQRCLMAIREQHCDEDEADFDLPVNLIAEIDVALSASAEPAPTADGFSAGDMADQGAKAFRDGAQASADLIQKRLDDYLNELGVMDPETGNVELPRGGDEYVCELSEIIELVRALPLPQ